MKGAFVYRYVTLWATPFPKRRPALYLIIQDKVYQAGVIETSPVAGDREDRPIGINLTKSSPLQKLLVAQLVHHEM